MLLSILKNPTPNPAFCKYTFFNVFYFKKTLSGMPLGMRKNISNDMQASIEAVDQRRRCHNPNPEHHTSGSGQSVSSE